MCLGGSMCDGGRTLTRFVGEKTSGDTVTSRHHHSRSGKTATCCHWGKSVFKNHSKSWQNILALSKLTDAETNVKMIRALANRYTENKGYDAESWNTLKAARDAALAYIAANPVS